MLDNLNFLHIVSVYLVVVNVICFALFAIDKKRAARGAWRIPENTLLLWAVLGGSPGGLLGMYVFRHKTRHVKFKWGFPLILIIQLLLASYFVWR